MMEGTVALEGNLTEFSLVDMFRLLQSGSKTGLLQVSRDDQVCTVCFLDGRIYFAGDIDSAEPAGARLVSAGVIAEKQLRQARGLMKIQRRDRADRKIGQILADEGYVEAQVLERFTRELVSDALFAPLTWDSGEIRFEPDVVLEPFDIGVSVPVDETLEEVGKRLDAWERIREKIPSMQTRFIIATGPGAKSNEIHIKPKEWMMLCHLHGGRSVAELVKLTGHNDFDVARVLYGMYAGGLITRIDEAGQPVDDA